MGYNEWIYPFASYGARGAGSSGQRYNGLMASIWYWQYLAVIAPVGPGDVRLTFDTHLLDVKLQSHLIEPALSTTLPDTVLESHT